MTPPRPVINLAVRTKSGRPLGVVVNVHVDPDTQGVTAYEVRPHRLIPSSMSRALLIQQAQVIGFDEQGLVVDDGVVTAPNSAPQPVA